MKSGEKQLLDHNWTMKIALEKAHFVPPRHASGSCQQRTNPSKAEVSPKRPSRPRPDSQQHSRFSFSGTERARNWCIFFLAAGSEKNATEERSARSHWMQRTNCIEEDDMNMNQFLPHAYS